MTAREALLVYEESRQDKVPPPQELRVRSSRGDYLTLEFIISPLVRHGLVEGVFGIARDITRRKLTRERLEKLNQCFISLGAILGKTSRGSSTRVWKCSGAI